MPPDLLDFQRDFVSAIDAHASGAMAVYRNTVIHGAVEAFRANYPVVEQILGSEMAEQVAVDFATQWPPRRPVLALYGERFADWLEAQPWIGDLAYLPDVARVERLRVESLLAADCEALGIDEVRQSLQTSGSLVGLHPAVRFTWLPTPAMSIWLAHQRPIVSDLALDWKAEGALFARPEPFVLHAPRIGRAAHRILFGMRLGETLEHALATAQKLYPDEDCEAVLASLANLGVFAAANSMPQPRSVP